MTNTLKPIEKPYPDHISAILSQYPQIDGYLLSLFRTFANSERFLLKGVPNLLDEESPLPIHVREIIILRITAKNNCEYEWGVHVSVFAKAAGLTEEQIAETCQANLHSTDWTQQEINLIKVVDELCENGAMSDVTKKRFHDDWSLEQQLEILALCGTYHTVSFVANTAKLPNEQFAASFPQ